jgi:hypothetical protein
MLYVVARFLGDLNAVVRGRVLFRQALRWAIRCHMDWKAISLVLIKESIRHMLCIQLRAHHQQY